MKACRRKYIEWGAAGIGALALFLFFFRILPYHLFHREQTQLFLLATEPLAGYLRHPAALARLSGDFLTQFFYYEGGGPAIMAVWPFPINAFFTLTQVGSGWNFLLASL